MESMTEGERIKFVAGFISAEALKLKMRNRIILTAMVIALVSVVAGVIYRLTTEDARVHGVFSDVSLAVSAVNLTYVLFTRRATERAAKVVDVMAFTDIDEFYWYDSLTTRVKAIDCEFCYNGKAVALLTAYTEKYNAQTSA